MHYPIVLWKWPSVSPLDSMETNSTDLHVCFIGWGAFRILKSLDQIFKYSTCRNPRSVTPILFQFNDWSEQPFWNALFEICFLRSYLRYLKMRRKFVFVMLFFSYNRARILLRSNYSKCLQVKPDWWKFKYFLNT